MTMHAIIYDRASTHLQEDNYSRINAETEGVRIAEQHGYTWEYVKEIGSGTTLSGRPKMMKILDRIAGGEIQRVIVQELDRLARPVERVVYETIRTTFIEYGVIVHTHNGTYDFTDDDSDFVADINMAVSKKEALRIKKRTRRGMVERVKSGKWVGSTPALGYKFAHNIENGKRVSDLAIDTEEAKLVQVIFDTMEATAGNIGKAGITLSDAGHRSKNGKKFVPSTLRRIVHRKMYIGIMESKLTDKVIHRPDLQIISIDQFERVQALIKSRKRGTPGAAGRYPFTGFVVCSTCGGPMVAANQKERGGIYYSCTNRRKYGASACSTGKSYRHKPLIEATTKLIAETIENSDLMTRLLNDAANEYGKTISEEAHEAAIDGELKVIKESRQRLIDAIAAGILTMEDAAQKMDELRTREQHLTVERASISEKTAIKDEILNAIQLINGAPLKEKLITIARKKPLIYRRLLGLVFEPNSLEIEYKTHKVYKIVGYKFTPAFASLLEPLSFCNTALSGGQFNARLSFSE